MGDVVIKSSADLEALRRACRLAAATLEEAAKLVAPGVSTDEINTFVHEHTLKHGARPAPLGYRGYPKSVCTSINEVICHGIPSARKLRGGDIVNIDVTSILDGWHGDVSATFYVGEPKAGARALVETTRECLRLGIAEVRPGKRLGDVGAAIQACAEGRGFSVVRDYVGHGIGRGFHEGPQVPHFGKRGRGMRLAQGMTFTIEPMINEGVWQMRILPDAWTAVTADGKLSAQFEHTVAVTADGVEVLTAFSAPLVNSDALP
ncbi:MAG: type I methionyl aminopeptidase [Proteobacteria bacterium]|jgi:methionyl aminopeptidase|nr:type I methionyl aminopeptidase [Pseudomonadota bacterium]